jgi:long-chain acyl-CoA synthetase
VTAGWAAQQGLIADSYNELVKLQAVHDLIEEHVGRLNVELNRWETIKKWALLERDLTVEGGELTPSLKVKRAVVAERYKELLDSFYL